MNSGLNLSSIVDIQRKSYARQNARDIIRALVDCRDPENYLAHKLDLILQTYEHGLEQMVKHFERVAYDAVMLQPPAVIVVKDKQ